MAKSRAEQVLDRRKSELSLGRSAVDVEPDKKGKKFIDTTDPETVKEQEKKSERRKKRKEEVLKDILSTTQGREWVSDLLVFCDVMGNPFVQKSSDGTAFNIGMQNVGKMLLNQIFEICPDKYPKMLKEAQERMEE